MALFWLALLAPRAWGQFSSGPFVISTSGGTATGGPFQTSITIGQSGARTVQTNGTFATVGGFETTAASTPITLVLPDITTNHAEAGCGQVVTFAPVVSGSPAPVLFYLLNGQPIDATAMVPGGTNTIFCFASNVLQMVSGSFTVVVSNEPPVAGTNSLSALEGETTSVAAADWLGQDQTVSGGVLSLAGVISPSPNGAKVTFSDGLVTYTPAAGFFGKDTITYTFSDGCSTASGTVAVTVAPAALPPQNYVALSYHANGASVVFLGVPGRSYQVLAAAVVTGPWVSLGSPLVAAPNGVVQYTDSTSPLPEQRFYRILYVP